MANSKSRPRLRDWSQNGNSHFSELRVRICCSNRGINQRSSAVWVCPYCGSQAVKHLVKVRI